MTAIALTVLLALPHSGPDTLVVCPEPFRAALSPWLQYRTGQGHDIAVISDASAASEIRDRIRACAARGNLRHVLLLGDSPAITELDNPQRPGVLPVHYAKAEVNILWGSEPSIATDNWYADLDDDQIPDVAIGRITADTAGELSRIVEKTIAYEERAGFGTWRRRLNFVAGVGGFGLVTDLVLESSVRFFLTQQIPASYAVSMTYGSWRSPYCPDPRLFHHTTFQRLSEGCLFWIYIGHGLPHCLDRISVPDADFPILSVADARRLDAVDHPPIALMLACYTGAMDAHEDCLAEEMLRAEGGPVAVLAGSRVTMPYAMAVLASGLLDQCFDRKCCTLGEAFLNAKRAMANETQDGNELRSVLDTLAAAISPAPSKLAAERAEHLLLFNLFGDPLLRLSAAESVDLEVGSSAKSGDVLPVAGSCRVDGRAIVELVVRRDRLAFRPLPRPAYPRTSGELARFQEVYERANDPRLAWLETPVKNGQFEAKLAIPPGIEGPCNVRVFVEGESGFALGAADIVVEN